MNVYEIGNIITKQFKTTKDFLQWSTKLPILFKVFLDESLKSWKRSANIYMFLWSKYLYTLNFNDELIIIAQNKDDLSIIPRWLEEEYMKKDQKQTSV